MNRRSFLRTGAGITVGMLAANNLPAVVTEVQENPEKLILPPDLSLHHMSLRPWLIDEALLMKWTVLLSNFECQNEKYQQANIAKVASVSRDLQKGQIEFICEKILAVEKFSYGSMMLYDDFGRYYVQTGTPYRGGVVVHPEQTLMLTFRLTAD